MASSRKKVVVRRFSPGMLWGYLPSSGFVQDGQLHLLDLSGRVQPVPLTDGKYVSYVRDFNTADTINPERLLRKSFLARPRTEGLWLRLTLRDGDRMEGLAPLDISLADTQRLYIPRSAIETMDTVAVVTTPTRKKAEALASTTAEQQPDLFSLPLPPDARTN